MQNERVICPECNGKNVIKRGRRKTKFGYRQSYYCKGCGKGFIGSKLSNKTYGPKVITNAITSYNLGNTLDESAKLVNRRFKVSTTKSSIHRWIEEFRDICTYHKLRATVLKNYGKGKGILFSKTFEHNGLAYNFRYHKPKLEIFCNGNGFSSLTEYIKGFEHGCPVRFFEEDDRCSQLRIDVKIKKEGRYNLACRLADFALKSCSSNRERHSIVENFMLVNDSSTIATEVPVWFWEKNLDVGICGHIDLLQARQGKIFVLDFKPGAEKENENKVASQLYLYASGLSFRTGIPLDGFRCAWFDGSICYEFNPKEARVRFPGSKWRSNPQATNPGRKSNEFGTKKQPIRDPDQATDSGRILARLGKE